MPIDELAQMANDTASKVDVLEVAHKVSVGRADLGDAIVNILNDLINDKDKIMKSDTSDGDTSEIAVENIIRGKFGTGNRDIPVSVRNERQPIDLKGRRESVSDSRKATAEIETGRRTDGVTGSNTLGGTSLDDEEDSMTEQAIADILRAASMDPDDEGVLNEGLPLNLPREYAARLGASGAEKSSPTKSPPVNSMGARSPGVPFLNPSRFDGSDSKKIDREIFSREVRDNIKQRNQAVMEDILGAR